MMTSWKSFIKIAFFKHERDTVGDFGRRALMHIPAGLIIGIPLLGKPFREIFIRYEENEDLHTKDEAWKDYFGALVGASITTLASLGLIVFLIIKFL